MIFPIRAILLSALLTVIALPANAKSIIRVEFNGSLGAPVLATAPDIDAWRVMKESPTVVPKPDLPDRAFLLSYTVDEHVGHEGQTVAVNEYRYIPSTPTTRGYLFFANVRGGWSSAVGTWFQLGELADSRIKEIIRP